MASNPFVQPFEKGQWSEGEELEQEDCRVDSGPQARAVVTGGDAAAATESWRAEVKQPLVPDSRGQPVTKATASAVGHPFLNQNLADKEVTEGMRISSTGFEEFNPDVFAARGISSFEPHCMFSSDSGIEMTPGDTIDLAKTFVDPIRSEKVEVQNYIDLCHSGETKAQDLDKIYWEEKMIPFVDDIRDDTEASSEIMKKSTEEAKLIEEISPSLSPEEPTTAPYVEEPSDEDISEKWEMGDTQQSTRMTATCSVAAQVMLTEIETIVDPNSGSKSQHEQETKPKQGSDLVPTVTVSEPDDDSPISQTPTPSSSVIDLLYWHDIKQTGIVFGSVLLLLFSLTQFSVVSVIAYLALAALSATISFRIYKSVLQAVQKTDEGHPFKSYLDLDSTLSEEQIQKYADSALVYVNSTVKELRRLFLVQDLVDSLKFAVLMWLLTYVGAIFNGLTLMIMAVVSMFTLPVVYEKYQAQIDQYLGLVRTHVNSVVAKIQAKIPGAKRKTE
ncbi:reticulon-1a isoform X2 [Leucoraja erinacea]|uniref:reticulon-1a isoform X2 n=1 Tax=Leucoraja erinaceus TaxID=7782 RepID=UPI002455806C|nr:reticulon-1a isoform X2 [Leucoraja erinacea]